MNNSNKPMISHGNGIFEIRLPLPFPRLKWVNSFVIASPDGLVLIDCGVDSEESWAALTEGIKAIGHVVQDITRLIGTHLHVDHIGMAPRLVEASGAQFLMHRNAASGIEEYNDWSLRSSVQEKLALRHGAPSEQAKEIHHSLKRPPWAPPVHPPTDLLLDSDRIVVDANRGLEVLHTPGHDPAHICLVDSKTNALFSGDHVLPRITPVVQYDDQEDRLGIYIASLQRIEKLGLKTTYPAHGTTIESGQSRARQIVMHHNQRLDAIVQKLRRGPATGWEIMEGIFRTDLPPVQKRLAFSETMAHVSHLEHRSQVTTFLEKEKILFGLSPNDSSHD